MDQSIFAKIENAITDYIQGEISVGGNVRKSQYDRLKRINLFANKVYKNGYLDTQGNYKYWEDIISPSILNEVKNIDFDTKNVIYYSDNVGDKYPILLLNSYSVNWMAETGQAERFNDFIEHYVGWGNLLWKKAQGDYDSLDLLNTYIINQASKTIDETMVIERHNLTVEKMKDQAKKWNMVDNINVVLKECRSKSFLTVKDDSDIHETTTPYYEVYEANGVFSLADIKEAKGEDKEDGDEDKFRLAKIVVIGLDGNLKDGNKGEKSKFVLHADSITKMPYKEAHRGRFTGTWLREGIIEALIDPQIRINEIAYQISRGLEYASKTIFAGEDKLVVRNILTDMKNGDYLKGKDIRQVSTRMEGFDQLMADYNRIIEHIRRLTNYYDVSTGESMASGTPFRLGALLDRNLNKSFDFIREKLSIGFKGVIEDWLMPDMLKDLAKEDLLTITGNSAHREEIIEYLGNKWLRDNIMSFGFLNKTQGEELKKMRIEELKKQPEITEKLKKEMFEDVKPRVKVVLDGENVNLGGKLESLAGFINMEADPVRRTAMIEKAMTISIPDMDISNLPKSEPEQMQPVMPGGQAQPGLNNYPTPKEL